MSKRSANRKTTKLLIDIVPTTEAATTSVTISVSVSDNNIFFQGKDRCPVSVIPYPCENASVEPEPDC